MFCWFQLLFQQPTETLSSKLEQSELGAVSCLQSQLWAQGMYLAQLGSCPAIQLQQGCCKQDQPGTALPDTTTCTRDWCTLKMLNASSEYWSWAQKSCGCYSNCYFIWHIFWSGRSDRHPSRRDALYNHLERGCSKVGIHLPSNKQ